MTSSTKRARPEKCTDEHLLFLDRLRESGATNMYGAGPFLVDAYHTDLTRHDAREILIYWMATFRERHP